MREFIRNVPSALPPDRHAPGKHDTEGRTAFLTVSQFGDLMGVRRSRAHALVASGKVPVVRFGRRLFIPRRGVEQLIDNAIATAEAHRG